PALDVRPALERAEQRAELTQIGAHIGEVRQAQREKITFGIERQFSNHFVGAAMAVRYEAAGAFVGPFHRLTERAGGVKETNIFRKHPGLHAERAADLAAQHMHVLGADAERFGEVRPHSEYALRRNVKREPAAII